ncbi:thiolase family protein [Zafaria sp. J156]|uniref:thiolase family protein n=1 Tax=Zafaria sp. J156 TaxID=3116490 RepID=UPI002E782DB7|nr:thiolase family protein [Zafaria sp. J156]MEE1620869.1 thiolase family protein [Zafaria sp. J156]
MREEHPVVVAARRTPIATRGRGLARTGLDGLAAPVLRAVADDAAAVLGTGAPFADVVLGNCMGPGGNPARVAALAAGLGHAVPGLTVDRQCGSGLAAVIAAAESIRAGDHRPRLAGGAESASTAPVRSIDGVPYDRAPFVPAGFPDPGMPEAAEDLARADGIPRSRLDAYAMLSHERAAAAHARGAFSAEIVPVAGLDDDGLRPGSGRLVARHVPLFPGGVVTAGNSCRISDGAAAVALVPSDWERAGGAGRPAGLALRAHAVTGSDPSLPGAGAAPAVLEALARSGVGTEALAAVELVEAFAAQTLAVLDRIGVAEDDERVCPDGGALAWGHPWGASGAVAVVRLFSRLVRGGAPAGTLGLAAASVGGGLGVAAVFEVVR